MKGETKVTVEETKDAVSDKGTMSRSKKARKGCMARSTKDGRTGYEKTRSSSRIANKSRECNMNEVSQGKRKRKRKRERGIVKHEQNPYVEQIDAAIQELDSRLGIQKKLKASYEKRLQYVKEILMSYSCLGKSASEEVNSCRAQIEKIKATTGSIFAEKLVGEICGLWQSGTGTKNEETLNELLTEKKYIISECVNKSHAEYEAYRKRLEENVMIEQACKRNRDGKASDLENIEGRIIEVNAVIAELQSALAVQQKYRKKLRSLGVFNNCGSSLHPRPIGHPICAKSDIIVISVSPCPVCTLGFHAKTLDIIVASCGHTFHPFCLVSDGKLLRKCPKCLCQMHEMWLKSFGKVEAGTSHSQPKNSEKFSATSQDAKIHPQAVAESTMESSEKCDTASTLAQVIEDHKSTMAGCE